MIGNEGTVIMEYHYIIRPLKKPSTETAYNSDSELDPAHASHKPFGYEGRSLLGG
jgi:hypothetical protein